MKRFALFVVLTIGLVSPSESQSQWVNISSGIPEIEFQMATADPKNPKLIFAASDRRGYRSEDGGVSWKRVLSNRGDENHVRFIYIDRTDSKKIYVCTDRGIYRSTD